MRAKGIEVVGISGDKVSNQQLFKKVHNLNYPLLSDEKGDVAKKFGLAVNKGGVFKFTDNEGKVHNLERGVSIGRTTVVIDKNGVIAAIDPITNAAGDAKRVAEVVNKLK